MTAICCRSRTTAGSSRVRRLCFLVVAAAALAAAGCSGGPVDQDWAAETEAQLIAESVDPAVVECVLDVGRRELTWGPLSEAAKDELLRNCQAAKEPTEQTGDAEEPPDELGALEQQWTFGDDPELDTLWVQCEGGTGSACDELFERAPVGSPYEDFGLTCGERLDLLHCAQLDEVDEPET